MFCQRNNLASGGDTPLHAWLKGTGRQYRPNLGYHYSVTAVPNENLGDVETFRLLLDSSKGEELEILNGLGNTVLHTTVMLSLPEHTRAVLDQNPMLLDRENTVGRTPSEIAYDIFTNHKASFVPPIDITHNRAWATTLIEREATTFAPDAQAPKSRRDTTWQVVQEYLPHANKRRRLVSLNEANDVARRLGETSSTRRASARRSRADSDDMSDEEEQEEAEVDYPSSLYKTCRPGAWAEEKPEDE